MSIKAFPLNQQKYSYNAQDVMKYYAGRNSGVFETGDNLKVSANGGLELRINTGMGWLAKDYVASVAFWNESAEYRMVEAGHDTYDRIDLVVVSWNFIQQEQNPTLIIRKGTPASSPVVPSLVNDSSTIEIALARINVAKGAITLSNSNIVDLRGNDTYCPMVYDEQTIRNAFVNCVGYADGVKKISGFPSVTPTASDKILVENGGTGKSTTIVKAVNTCSLTFEKIMASTNLTGKVASASALKEVATLDLLWTNASPTSSFSSQNLYMDLTKYRAIIIEVCEYGGVQARADNRFSSIVFKRVAGSVTTYFYNSGKYILSFTRTIYVLDDRVYISDSADSNGVNNVGAIPQKIWGLK